MQKKKRNVLTSVANSRQDLKEGSIAEEEVSPAKEYS
jgi:hypothetical protein